MDMTSLKVPKADAAAMTALDYCGNYGCPAGLWAVLNGHTAPDITIGQAMIAMEEWLFNAAGGTGERLPRWARANPDLWGNRYGEYIWNDARAFGVELSAARRPLPLACVVSHWDEVAWRLIQGARRRQGRAPYYGKEGLPDGSMIMWD